MSNSLAELYSGVVINQNQIVQTTQYAAGNGAWRQEFFLPADYRRGTESDELRYPDLSGFQLLVQITPGYAEQAAFDYSLEYQIFGLGWITATSGVTIGAPSDGMTWMTAYFDPTIETDATKSAARWRINFTGRSAVSQPKDVPVDYADGVANVFGNRIVANLEDYKPWPFLLGGVPAFLVYDPADRQAFFSYQQGIERFYIASPNPLAFPDNVKAKLQSTDAPLDAGGGAEASFDFRILALTADSGIDFLGNSYRSVLHRNSPDNISTSLGADSNQYWFSKPYPSKFAVESLYFDVRKSASTTYGQQNLVPNPSFEVDLTGWFDNSTGTVGNLTRSTTWSSNGTQSARWKANSAAGTTFPGFSTTQIPVKVGHTYSCRADVNIITLPTGSPGMSLILRFLDAVNAPLGDSVADITSTSDTLVVTGVAPNNAASVEIIIYTTSTAASPVELYVDSVCLIDGTIASLTYFDGDSDRHIWSGVPHNSTSFELVEPDVSDEASVVDRLLIDPITSGVYFNIYYTCEGDPGTNEGEWESKLWTRVPQTYRMERRETHVLPEPIKACYVKIEFSHLQAQHYAPGDFQQATHYKKHPKWVLDYFLAQASVSQGNPFLAQSVQVIYDALDLAYNYYLDDLGQEPQSIIDVNNTATTTVTNFLSNRTDASDRIDPTTLDKISLVMNGFRLHPVLSGTTDTLLADYAKGTVSYNDDYPVEQNPPAALNLPDVSSLNRDAVVIEQNFPVMFFFLTCRHAYREVEAKFSHDRAYFVGVRELAFLRDNYMTAFDTGTYIEPAADTQNVERNEFV